MVGVWNLPHRIRGSSTYKGEKNERKIAKIIFFVTNMGQLLEKILKKTLWLWLPFFAFGILVKEFANRSKK